MRDVRQCVIVSISAYRTGRWQIDYAQVRPDGRHIYVVSAAHSREFLVVRNDLENSALDQIVVQDIGVMSVHSAICDPAFVHLSEMLARFSDVQVLRYRPAKRITIAANHPAQGEVILKCVASGVESIYGRLSSVWESRTEFDFTVSQPISIVSMSRLFVQRRLSGVPVQLSNQQTLANTVGDMARAVGSLHQSRLHLADRFTAPDQLQRSERYLKQIETRFPHLAIQTERLRQSLSDKTRAIGKVGRTLYPIHGSLHLHQWLVDPDRLGLVDFDRACMGDVELDLATFVAQWDYEAEPLKSVVRREFVHAYVEANKPFDVELFAYYRAHKHLSKAYKAAKGADKGPQLDKLTERLSNALRVLDQQEGFQ